MKISISVLKLAALILSALAFLCLLIANLEAITDCLDSICAKTKGRFCGSCGRDDDSLDEWDDDEYEDWDD